METRHRTRFLATGAALLLLAGAGAGAGAYALLDDPTTTPATGTQAAASVPVSRTPTTTIGQAFTRAAPGVVEITVSGSAGGGGGSSSAQGSGFVYDTAGHVVTNQHVVDGASGVSVRFSNGKSYDATVVGTDRSTDLAVLDVDAPSSVLRSLALADSDTLRIGDTVLAIGSPFGLEGTLTSGIVSALHRSMTSPNGFAIDDSIQTDAAINHGNSGGPLLDLAGRVVGVNAQIESESGGNDGVGFAIPSNTVKSVVSQILDTGSVRHAYLGVATGDDAAGGGATLTEVRPGTPAESAGLQAGDVVTAFDGQGVASAADLQRLVSDQAVGDRVKVTYQRDGREHTATVTLGDRPS